jgi:hypothetical protein
LDFGLYFPYRAYGPPLKAHEGLLNSQYTWSRNSLSSVSRRMAVQFLLGGRGAVQIPVHVDLRVEYFLHQNQGSIAVMRLFIYKYKLTTMVLISVSG